MGQERQRRGGQPCSRPLASRGSAGPLCPCPELNTVNTNMSIWHAIRLDSLQNSSYLNFHFKPRCFPHRKPAAQRAQELPA